LISRRSLIARVMAAVLLSSLAAAGAIAYQAVRVRSLIADLSLIHDDFVPVSRQLDELRRESRAVGRALALNDTEALRRTLRNSQELTPSMLRLEHALITLDRQIELLAREATGAEAASLVASLIAAAEELHVEQQRLRARISDLAVELEANTSAVDAKQRDAERLATRFESRIDRLGTLVDGFADRAFELAREKEQQTVRYVVIAVALSLMVASIALLYVARALRAVDALRIAALRLRTGDYRAAELPESDDEIGDLAREFGHMSASISERDQRLRSQNQELEAANDALQREHDARLRAERLAAAGELASRITHEIRNPLSSMGLNAEMLADSLTGASEDARFALRRIESDIARLNALTEDYLSLARQPRIDDEPVNLASLLRGLLLLLEPEAARNQTSITSTLPAEALVLGSTDGLQQVFLNLLQNAIRLLDALPDGRARTIEVTAELHTSTVALHIDDSGPGIAPADLPHLFEPFWTRRPGGTGLGLTISRRIVELQGGTISVAPAGPLGGARFTVTLPRSPAPDAAQA